MERNAVIETFRTFLGKTDYRGAIVPLGKLFSTRPSMDLASGRLRAGSELWQSGDMLKTFERIRHDESIISDWSDYQTEQYVELWCLGVAQLIYAHLHQGEFCLDFQTIREYLDLLFGNNVFKPLHFPSSLPALALRANEKKDLREGNASQLIVDIDIAPNPENKLKYVCNYLYSEDDVKLLAEILDFYGEQYASPIDEDVLVSYWLDKKLRKMDEGCFWKALRHIMAKSENQEKYAFTFVSLFSKKELRQVLADGFSLDFPIFHDGEMTYHEFLARLLPLAEIAMEYYRDIPDEEQTFHDERLCALCNQAISFKKGEGQNA